MLQGSLTTLQQLFVVSLDGDKVWLVGGGSGHGFKHGIMLGEYAARRALGEPTNPEWDAFFALKEQTF